MSVGHSLQNWESTENQPGGFVATENIRAVLCFFGYYSGSAHHIITSSTTREQKNCIGRE